jgi:Xaa-Pro dipeptidase
MSPLDWTRATKTPYEVDCIREAGRLAATGHAAVRAGVAALRSERELHQDYLSAAGMLDSETPYGNIVAWDDRAATLHYETKRATRPDPGHVFLIDAGALHLGYASDITRTYARDGAHPVFRSLLDGMEEMQRQLVASVRPGTSYPAIHQAAHRGVAKLLTQAGVLRVSAEAAFERGLTRPFFPHGVGHHLGLQVHDVGGKQVSPRGDRQESPAEHPFLRTTRDLAPGHVVTIEPGLYFIPMLLEPFRSGPDAAAFDWGLVDALTPCGGIRIEDDILVTDGGHEDLTRPFVPGHRDHAIR